MNPIDEILLRTIEELIQRRRETKHVPYHILYQDVIAAVNGSLQRLENSGKITTGRTINDRWINVDK